MAAYSESGHSAFLRPINAIPLTVNGGFVHQMFKYFVVMTERSIVVYS